MKQFEKIIGGNIAKKAEASENQCGLLEVDRLKTQYFSCNQP